MQIAKRDIMVRTAVKNVVQTVKRPGNATSQQGTVLEGVNKDGQEIHVIKVHNHIYSVLLKHTVYNKLVYFYFRYISPYTGYYFCFYITNPEKTEYVECNLQEP